MRSVAAGAMAGLAASWVMNRFQGALGAVGLRPESGGDATVRTARRLAAMTGTDLPERHEAAAGSAVHYAFGALTGAAYGVAGRHDPRIRSGFGTPFATAVFLVADETLVPAAGLAQSPRETPLPVHAYGLVSHLLFGIVLEAALRIIPSEGRAAHFGRPL